jgi:EmrB/QacA subfamily drug resistance transporter
MRGLAPGTPEPRTGKASENAGSRPQGRVALLLVLAASGCYTVQQTLVYPSLAALQRDLHTTTAWAAWVITGFLLTGAVSTPLSGKVGDQYGKKRALVAVLVLFFLGSVGAALAPNIWVLIMARMVQGVGGGIVPLGYAILKDELPPERVGGAVAMLASLFAAGGGLGFVLSGVLVDTLSWRFIFAIVSLPTLATLVLVVRFLPESRHKNRVRFDVVGAVLLITALVTFLIAITEGSDRGWDSPAIVGLLTVSVIAFAAWIFAERRIEHPLVDLNLMTRKPILLSNIGAFLAAATFVTWYLIVPMLAQLPDDAPENERSLVHFGLGASATTAGLYMIPSSIFALLAGFFTGRFSRRYGMRPLIVVGGVASAIAFLAVAAFPSSTPVVVIAAIGIGIGQPTSNGGMAKSVIDAVPASDVAIGTSMLQVQRLIGGVVGGQIAAIILSSETIGGTNVPSEEAFITALLISAVLSLGSIVAAPGAPRHGPRRAAALDEPAVQAI